MIFGMTLSKVKSGAVVVWTMVDVTGLYKCGRAMRRIIALRFSGKERPVLDIHSNVLTR